MTPTITADGSIGTAPAGRPTPGCAGIVVDRAAGTVGLPAGVGLDLGGIGKGAAADLVVRGLRARGVTSGCVGMGGDVHAFGPGNGPDGAGWAITVEDPMDPTRAWFTHVVDDGAALDKALEAYAALTTEHFAVVAVADLAQLAQCHFL